MLAGFRRPVSTAIEGMPREAKMEKRAIENPDKAPSPDFNWAVEISGHERLLFITGTTAVGADGAIHFPGDAPGQARWILESFGRVLANAGYGWSDVVRVETTVAEGVSDADLEQIKHIRAEFVGSLPVKPAAGTLRIVSRLARPDMLVELEVIAAR
jgi:enamine deaminase RidA (YjgF/YER057c/UK114 family)